MTPIPPIESGMPVAPLMPPVAERPASSSFSDLLVEGVGKVNTSVLDAQDTVRAFVLDDSIPVHQVTYALERARLSLELMLQVRNRLVDGYQQFMNMQL